MPFYLEKTLFSPKAHARHIYMISPSSFIFSGMAKRVLPQVGDLRGKVGQSAPLLYPSCQSFSFPSTVLFTDTSYSTLSLYSLRPNNSGSGAVNISAKMSLQSQKSQIQKKKKRNLRYQDCLSISESQQPRDLSSQPSGAFTAEGGMLSPRQLWQQFNSMGFLHVPFLPAGNEESGLSEGPVALSFSGQLPLHL